MALKMSLQPSVTKLMLLTEYIKTSKFLIVYLIRISYVLLLPNQLERAHEPSLQLRK